MLQSWRKSQTRAAIRHDPALDRHRLRSLERVDDVCHPKECRFEFLVFLYEPAIYFGSFVDRNLSWERVFSLDVRKCRSLIPKRMAETNYDCPAAAAWIGQLVFEKFWLAHRRFKTNNN